MFCVSFIDQLTVNSLEIVLLILDSNLINMRNHFLIIIIFNNLEFWVH